MLDGHPNKGVTLMHESKGLSRATASPGETFRRGPS